MKKAGYQPREIIELFRSYPWLADAINRTGIVDDTATEGQVQKWAERNSIPSKWHASIVRVAASEGHDLTHEQMNDAQARRIAPAGKPRRKRPPGPAKIDEERDCAAG